MKRSLFCLAVAVCVLGSTRCFALDWITLHERADAIDLGTAQKAVEEASPLADSLYVLGLAYLNRYEVEKARQAFERLIDLVPGSKEGLWGEAEVLRRLHRFDESSRILEGLIKAYPGYYPPYLTLAYIKFIRMQFRDSADLALRVVRRRRKDADLTTYVRAHLIYAGAKGMLAYRADPVSRLVNGVVVLPTLQEAASMKPDSPEVLYGLGSYYLLAPRGLGKNIRQAKKYLERAVVEDPLFVDGYVRLAQVYKIVGNGAKYRQLLDAALRIDPDSELALDVKDQSCRFLCPERGED